MLTLCLTTTEQRLTLDRQKESKARQILGGLAMDPRSQRRRAGKTKPSFLKSVAALNPQPEKNHDS